MPDNSTIQGKIALRRHVVGSRRGLVVFESYAGHGEIFNRVWHGHASAGVAIEKDTQKAERIARQRPTWRVYRGESISCIEAGIAADMAIDVLDVDAWGDPWGAVSAFFARPRAFRQSMAVVITDGLAQKARRDPFSSGRLRPWLSKLGRDVYLRYAVIQRGELEAAIRGVYSIDVFESRMASPGVSHCWARLSRMETVG